MPPRRSLLLLFVLSAASGQLPPFPGAQIVSGPVGFAQQVSTSIELNAPYPLDIQGQAILSFTAASGTFDDPFIIFSTGSRTVSFTMPAGMVRRPLPAFQTGTVEGTITLTVRLLAQGMELPAPVPRTFVLPHRPPSIVGGPCVTATASGFSVSASGFTTNRNLVSAQITILPAPGDPAPARTFNIDIRAAAAAYFQSPASAPFGGQFQLTLPFLTSDGSLPGALLMRLSNLEGPPSPEGTSGSYRDRCLASTQTGLTFQTIAGGGTVPAQTFRLAANPSFLTRVPFSVAASTFPEGLTWLNVSPQQGFLDSSGAGTSISVSARPTGLAPGVYYGLVQVVSDLPNSPQSITVALNVAPNGQSRPPLVTPTGLTFTAEEGGPAPGEKSVRIVNLTDGALVFSATLSSDSPAFSVSPATGTVPPSQPTELTLRANPAGLAAGEYRGQLLIRFPGDGSTQAVGILLLVTPRPPQAASASRLAAGDPQAGCSSARLLPVFSLLSSGFRTSVAAPTPIETIVVDDCGRALETGRVAVTFSNGDSPLELTTLGDGRWSATWSPQNPRTESTIATVTAEDFDRGIRGSAAIGGTVQADPEAAPSIGSGGVVSAASLLPGASPGDLVSVFGINLADGVESAAQLPLQSRVQGASLILGGRRLPMLYAGPGQINAVVPYDLTAGATLQLIVQRGNRLSVPEPVRVSRARPAVLTIDSSGKGQGHIYIGSTDGRQLLAGASNPAKAGDVLTVYGTGLGAVDPPSLAGAAAPSGNPSRVTGPLSVKIGGVEAEVLFAGLVPAFTGLYQLNVRMPAGVTASDQVPLEALVSGVVAPAVTFAAQ